MKKNCLLPVCLLCICGIAACSSNSYEAAPQEIYLDEEDASAVDFSVQSDKKCGTNGVSCNDSALINYSRTEADYRAYGERTKRDHLYTQASTGNNLTASIPPSIEEDVVVRPAVVQQVVQKERPYRVDDGVFTNTTPQNFATPTKEFSEPIVKPEPKVAQVNNIKKQQQTEDIPTKRTYEVICEDDSCTPEAPATSKYTYEIVCEDECEDILNTDKETITSEFTEESFDIADYVTEDKSEIEFKEVGSKEELQKEPVKTEIKETIVADIHIDEVKINDNTVLTWEANEGDNLRDLLSKWSAMAGWKLLWQTNRNYTLSAGVTFKGNFADVSSALVRAFARARPAPIATYYKGNRVIVVETMENENAY